jgi:hypothetical protein
VFSLYFLHKDCFIFFCLNLCHHTSWGWPGSSVSIGPGYGLYNRAIEVRSPAGAKDFSFILCVQTGSGAHPASCTMGTRGPFPGTKRGRSVTLTTHPHLVPRSRMSRSYTSSPPKRLRGVWWDSFSFNIPWGLKFNDLASECPVYDGK